MHLQNRMQKELANSSESWQESTRKCRWDVFTSRLSMHSIWLSGSHLMRMSGRSGTRCRRTLRLWMLKITCLWLRIGHRLWGPRIQPSLRRMLLSWERVHWRLGLNLLDSWSLLNSSNFSTEWLLMIGPLMMRRRIRDWPSHRVSRLVSTCWGVTCQDLSPRLGRSSPTKITD